VTGALSYGESVVKVLCEHTPFLRSPMDATIVAEIVDRKVNEPKGVLEVIVDDPVSANWRLRARGDNKRVRLVCYRLNRRPADYEMERAVNDALDALEA
jgi:hypothetical protein